ncbi:MAG: protease modulator HflC [Lachnospiraceae bacterium]|nr:protease modulator HflC [Lachnospiraceae bacterium]
MKKGIIKGFIIIIAVAAIMVVSGAMYTVKPNEYVAVRQFGRIVTIVDNPGLHFKIPFIQNIQVVSKATRIYDVPLSDVITKDKKSMIADDYVLWKVVDPMKYIRTLDAIGSRAEERIEAAVYNALKNVISSMNQDEVIEARGEKLTQMLTAEANSDIDDYGILILVTEIKALDLPDDNKEAVYERMISERENIAAAYRAQGEAEAQKIKNETDKTTSVMKSNAYKDAQVLVAEGEAEYMNILREAYNTEEKADFYNFLRSLDALDTTLKGSNKTIILDKDSELVKILYGSSFDFTGSGSQEGAKTDDNAKTDDSAETDDNGKE